MKTHLQIREKEQKQVLKVCPICEKPKGSVIYRSNAYAQDVGNTPDAMWEACDECDYENRMDI